MGQNFPSGLGAILINKKKMKDLSGKEFLCPRYYVQLDTLNVLFMSFEQTFKSTFWEREKGGMRGKITWSIHFLARTANTPYSTHARKTIDYQHSMWLVILASVHQYIMCKAIQKK
jgi:hypothetical protein